MHNLLPLAAREFDILETGIGPEVYWRGKIRLEINTDKDGAGEGGGSPGGREKEEEEGDSCIERDVIL